MYVFMYSHIINPIRLQSEEVKTVFEHVSHLAFSPSQLKAAYAQYRSGRVFSNVQNNRSRSSLSLETGWACPLSSLFHTWNVWNNCTLHWAALMIYWGKDYFCSGGQYPSQWWLFRLYTYTYYTVAFPVCCLFIKLLISFHWWPECVMSNSDEAVKDSVKMELKYDLKKQTSHILVITPSFSFFFYPWLTLSHSISVKLHPKTEQSCFTAFSVVLFSITAV